MSKYEYSYPTEELDKIIEKLNMGIILSIPDEMMIEARMREQELREELFDDDDDPYFTDEQIEQHKQMMAKKIEENKHKAHHEDIKVYKISDRERARLAKAVSASLVRPMVSDYVKSDEELYSSETERKLKEKMSRLKARYQNPTDYKNAMNIIREYVDFKVIEENKNHTVDEIYEAFHNGEIKLNIRLPKLFSDFVHEVTDPKILAEIAEGKVTLKTKNELDEEIEIKDYSKSKTLDYQFKPITDEEYRRFEDEYNHGIKNILTPMFNNSKGAYGRFSLPRNNIFAKIYNEGKKPEDTYIQPINYEDDEQVEAMLNKRRGFNPSDPNNIVNLLNSANDNKLSYECRNRIVRSRSVPIYSTEINQKRHKPMTVEFQPHQASDRQIAIEQAMIGSLTSNDYKP